MPDFVIMPKVILGVWEDGGKMFTCITLKNFKSFKDVSIDFSAKKKVYMSLYRLGDLFRKK